MGMYHSDPTFSRRFLDRVFMQSVSGGTVCGVEFGGVAIRGGSPHFLLLEAATGGRATRDFADRIDLAGWCPSTATIACFLAAVHRISQPPRQKRWLHTTSHRTAQADPQPLRQTLTRHDVDPSADELFPVQAGVAAARELQVEVHPARAALAYDLVDVPQGRLRGKRGRRTRGRVRFRPQWHGGGRPCSRSFFGHR